MTANVSVEVMRKMAASKNIIIISMTWRIKTASINDLIRWRWCRNNLELATLLLQGVWHPSPADGLPRPVYDIHGKQDVDGIVDTSSNVLLFTLDIQHTTSLHLDPHDLNPHYQPWPWPTRPVSTSSHITSLDLDQHYYPWPWHTGRSLTSTHTTSLDPDPHDQSQPRPTLPASTLTNTTILDLGIHDHPWPQTTRPVLTSTHITSLDLDQHYHPWPWHTRLSSTSTHITSLDLDLTVSDTAVTLTYVSTVFH